MNFCKKQVAYYNCTAYEILTNEIGLILAIFQKDRRHKRGMITSLDGGFISLAYEGISRFLNHKCQKHYIKQCQQWKRKKIYNEATFSFGKFHGYVWDIQFRYFRTDDLNCL